MPIGAGAAIGAGASLIPSIFQIVQGASQAKKAKGINPVDPNFQMNGQVIDNARMLQERYGNYQLPNYGAAKDQIQSNASNAFAQGIQGASSSGDVLDLASKIAFGSNQATNDLATQSAIGKEGALKDFLGANAAAGQQYQDKNAYDRERYMDKLREKAALQEASAQNIMGSLENVGATASSLATSGLLGGAESRGSLPNAVKPVSSTIESIGAGQINSPFNAMTIPSSFKSPTSQEDYIKMLQQQLGFKKI